VKVKVGCESHRRASVQNWGSVQFSSYAVNKLSPRGRRDDMPPADGSSTRGGSTSVRERVRSPPMAKLQATSMPIA